ncbi:beta-ketoacyl synthase N-terminal-like domain-containing protein [Actinokineospora diospyrosa]|uniref:3-oxoacyl-[acyl-carrier-protein] synthase II n=1 Tax=Actinokineospora diospyrosa TaxID=103728 RepID=A0ABT1I9T9_9PSEU|nr:beta-ketoacyl synthase N-terminal-like domain-containing protein [Actinokineospora diospyrosa]MCP2269402.1 3-oxoacyl-[acyl-carrier-protein] synthase II [Actinokineospora diospyrosa]
MIAITGVGVVAGGGAVEVGGMFDEELPGPVAHVIRDFDVRAQLGRKGTSGYDRTTALAVVGCGRALESIGSAVDGHDRARFGVVLGTTAGGVRATSDFSRATIVEDRPYHVNPVLFPAAVMNSAAGHSAIRYGLKGVNATIAAGQLAGVRTLRYTGMTLARGYADAVLVGAAEEFSPHTAWADHLRYGGRGVLPGEGAVVFVAERAADVRAAGRVPLAEVLATAVSTSGDLSEVLRRALAKAEVKPSEVWAVATGERGIPERDHGEVTAVAEVFGDVERIRVKETVGECHAASGAFQVAALLERSAIDSDVDGRPSVVTGTTSDGAVGAVVLRGWRRADRGDGV